MGPNRDPVCLPLSTVVCVPLFLLVCVSASSQEDIHPSGTNAAHTIASDAVSPGVPQLLRVYQAADPANAGTRVEFVQHGTHLEAIWIRDPNDVYGRGTYEWDGSRQVFAGKVMSRVVCEGDDVDQRGAVSVIQREEISAVDGNTIRDRWAKPLRVACAVGVSEVYKWVETTWSATSGSRR